LKKKEPKKYSPLYLQKLTKMEHKKRSSGLYWVLFLLSVAAFFGVYAVGGGYCSMILPFNVTFFAMAMDLM
jgi:hypothetical protein